MRKVAVNYQDKNSVSPSAKIKTQRKSGEEEMPPVNGVEIVTEKEQLKSVKVDQVLNKGKASPGARRQSVSKNKVGWVCGNRFW